MGELLCGQGMETPIGEEGLGFDSSHLCFIDVGETNVDSSMRKKLAKDGSLDGIELTVLVRNPLLTGGPVTKRGVNAYIEYCGDIMIRHVRRSTFDDECTVAVLGVKTAILVVHGIGAGDKSGAGRGRDSDATNWTKINRAVRRKGTDKTGGIRNRSLCQVSKIGRVLVLQEGRRRHGASRRVSVVAARSKAGGSWRKLHTSSRAKRSSRRNRHKGVLCLPSVKLSSQLNKISSQVN